MHKNTYRVESTHPIYGPFSPQGNACSILLEDRALALVVAAKSVTRPMGNEIRVIHTPSGQVIFSKTAANPSADFEDVPAASPKIFTAQAEP